LALDWLIVMMIQFCPSGVTKSTPLPETPVLLPLLLLPRVTGCRGARSATNGQ
jgi:hypothetical protein